ncbi:MAG TPA: FAD-dependent oxidoreductase [Mollicutes bacterium]|nr:FAD-dependent oxidoreductase [Mollicutes bacterium]
MYDCIIIGGGPAGMTAAIYTARAGLKTLILERESIGGQISTTTTVENYPGFMKIDGGELSIKMYDQVVNSGAEFVFEEVTKILDGEIKTVETKDNKYEGKTIIIATGATFRKLNTDSEKKFIGKGIHFCASCDANFYKNQDVAVIGGGNTAVTNAIYLADLAKKVYVIYRGEKLRCELPLENKLNEYNNIEIIYNTNVIDFLGQEKLEEIVIKTNDQERNIKVSGVFESIGMIPETRLAVNLIDINDETEYIISEECKTELPGIFVAGDCREKEVRQLTTATSDGTLSATHVINYIKKIN